MDQTDAKILDILQTNASLPMADVAGQVGIDEQACKDRIQRLKDEGVILEQVALVDARKVGANMTAFVAITTPEHSTEWLEGFHAAVANLSEVVEFYRMSGQVDYLLRVVVPDIDAYDAFYKRLIAIGGLSDVQSAFSMEQIKYTTELPLPVSGTAGA